MKFIKSIKSILTLAPAAALGIMLLPAQADAAMMSSAKAIVAPASSNVVTASFWARPYPYGYSGWRRCRNGVRVETPYGWRCQSVGYGSKDVILRSRG
jgi:hypothetical protein